jgi:hypothetical protein
VKLLRRMNGDQTAETVVDGPAPAERSLSLDDLDKALQAAERELAEAKADLNRIPDLEAALRDLARRGGSRRRAGRSPRPARAARSV